MLLTLPVNIVVIVVVVVVVVEFEQRLQKRRRSGSSVVNQGVHADAHEMNQINKRLPP